MHVPFMYSICQHLRYPAKLTKFRLPARSRSYTASSRTCELSKDDLVLGLLLFQLVIGHLYAFVFVLQERPRRSSSMQRVSVVIGRTVKGRPTREKRRMGGT